MNKAVLISIHPQWCEKILSGKKTIEVRKTRPKIDTPFKCYIYCTKGMELWGDGTGNTWRGIAPDQDIEEAIRLNPTLSQLNGKVIGEFMCRGFMQPYSNLTIMAKYSCLTIDELNDYVKGKELYGLRITDLKIYDQPKELNEFSKHCNNNANCFYCKQAKFNGGNCNGRITRPPQSWCYVEEIEL